MKIVCDEMLSAKIEAQGLTGSLTARRYRFLYLIGQLHTGGSERQLYYLLKTMTREGYLPAVAVWTYREKDVYVRQVRELGVPIFWFSDPSRLKKLTAFRSLVRTLRPEVVHSFSFYTNFVAYFGTQGTSAVAIGSIRSDWSYAKKSNGRLLSNLSARWPSTQTSNSLSVVEEINGSTSFFTPQRIAIVHNAIDLEQFENVSIGDKRPVEVAGVGYLLPVKRWDRLLSACHELIKMNDLDFSVKIAGDGPLLSSLQKKASELDLAERVDFVGHIDNVPKLLAEASFLVHAADSEGSPNSVLEAMACGRAVICTNVGDASSVVEDGRTGFLVHAGDHRSLVERMRRLITDRTLCRMMGLAGRAKVEREFSLDRLVKETLSVYRTAGWVESSSR